MNHWLYIKLMTLLRIRIHMDSHPGTLNLNPGTALKWKGRSGYRSKSKWKQDPYPAHNTDYALEYFTQGERQLFKQTNFFIISLFGSFFTAWFRTRSKSRPNPDPQALIRIRKPYLHTCPHGRPCGCTVPPLRDPNCRAHSPANKQVSQPWTGTVTVGFKKYLRWIPYNLTRPCISPLSLIQYPSVIPLILINKIFS